MQSDGANQGQVARNEAVIRNTQSPRPDAESHVHTHTRRFEDWLRRGWRNPAAIRADALALSQATKLASVMHKAIQELGQSIGFLQTVA